METHITFVLDSSGSMSMIEDDTVGGFNAFLDNQRDEPGTATVSLYDFNSNVNLIYEGRAIEAAPQLDGETYTPSGRTALHDAISRAIEETDAYVARLPPAERPKNVIVVILTDGKENASETPQPHIRELVTTRRKEYEWEFLFIGANQDAALTASDMGMDADRSLDMAHSGDGAMAAYESTSERISNARRTGTTGGYEEEDRKRQDNAEDS